MADPVLEEVRDLLQEIRELLVPVSDAHIDEYHRRQAERNAQRVASIKALLSTEKRWHAWRLADGSRTQRQIAQQAHLDEGGASKFFRALRSLRAVEDRPNPTRTLEVD